MCTAPKTGCTGWTYFFLYHNDGILVPRQEAKRHPELIHSTYAKNRISWTPLRVANLSESEMLARYSGYPHFVVARNPYVRFISSWKDWKVRTNRPNVTFAEFVDIYEHKKQEIPLQDHVDPVSWTCMVNRPLRYTVLRIEELSLWFDGFMDKYNLTDTLHNYTALGGPILFEPAIHDATVLSVPQVVAAVAGQAPWPGGAFESVHHQGSANEVTQHYTTPALVQSVTNLMMDDFVNFGYPLWDGHADTFRFV